MSCLTSTSQYTKKVKDVIEQKLKDLCPDVFLATDKCKAKNGLEFR